jgi:hypothetical protein
VSTRLDVVDARSSHVYCREVQRVWRDVVQQLQRRLRLPCCIDVIDTACGDVSVWDVQHIWGDVVQQLQRGLRVSVPWCCQWHCAAMLRRQL